MDRAVTAALSTPHDAVLAEIYGRPSTLSPLKTDVGSHAQGPRILSSAGSLDRTVSPSFAGLQSAASSPDHSPEPVYDPFTGGLAGVIVPPRPERDREPSNAPLDQVKDELWAHLARIRELQSEIAGMHVQMEGIGLGEVRGTKRAAGVGRVHSDTIHATEEWEDPDAAAEHGKAARDAEFTQLTESFKTRRTAIDGIMDKLGDLSKSLTTFHALPTPAMDFTTTRSTTKESTGTTISPDLRGPTRSTTAASNVNAAVLPESPVSIELESPLDVRRA
ncbi:hypothetical protein B0H21DRAFT_685694 [Amylocystis lapponica]|nr:hypothetical protein B0H21DRAFT_685694 [Amylocystis lapponica]